MSNSVAKISIAFNGKKFDFSYESSSFENDYMMWMYDFLQVGSEVQLKDFAFNYGMEEFITNGHFEKFYLIDVEFAKVFVSEDEKEWKELTPSYEI